MRSWLFAPPVLALLVVARAASADVAQPIRDANSDVAASVVARHLSYAEANGGFFPGAPDPIDSESGWLPGARLDAKIQRTVLGIHDLYLAGYVDHFESSVTYDGAIEHIASDGTVSTTPITLTSGAAITDAGLALGVGVPIGDIWALTPVLRYAYRNWHRTVGQGTSSEYVEVYTHHEFGLGALFQVAATDRLVLGAEGSLAATIAPNMENQGISPPLELGLGSKTVIAGGLALDFAATRAVHLVAGWNARTFGYGQSASVRLPPPNQNLAAHEPSSTTTEHDLHAGVAVSF